MYAWWIVIVFLSYRYFIYFKRSFVKRVDGQFIGYPSIDSYPDVYPLTYSIAEAYVQLNKFNLISSREIDILCTLRGSKLMTTRQRVSDWVKDYGATRKVENIVTEQVAPNFIFEYDCTLLCCAESCKRDNL